MAGAYFCGIDFGTSNSVVTLLQADSGIPGSSAAVSIPPTVLREPSNMWNRLVDDADQFQSVSLGLARLASEYGLANG